MTSTVAESEGCGGLTTSGRHSRKGVYPSLPQKSEADARSLLPAGHRNTTSSDARSSKVYNVDDSTIDATANADYGVVIANDASNAISGGFSRIFRVLRCLD